MLKHRDNASVNSHQEILQATHPASEWAKTMHRRYFQPALLLCSILACSNLYATTAANTLSTVYEPAPAELRAIAQHAQSSRVLEGWRAEIEQLNLEPPLTLGLVMRSCGEANAYYDSEAKSIVYCYEELLEAQATLTNHTDQLSPKEAQLFATGWRDFVFFHELGHALIDQLEIPMLGREEDVADQISTYIWVHREDSEAILNGTIYSFSAQDAEVDEETLADTHSLNAQRYYNVMCWVYGADQERYEEAGEQLPEERREGCEYEYWQLENAIEQLLPDVFSQAA